MNTVPENHVTFEDRPASIVLSGLVKSFGPVHAVRGVDIEIGAGETVALLGPNGAGKSTTIDLLLGLARPDAGTVSIFRQTPAEAVKAGAIGAMLQTGALIRDLSVKELIIMVASLYPHPLPVDEVLRLAGIEDIADRRTHKLSGGQTQRARFAVALVADAELLVLDEPTVALDVEGRHEFWTAMRAFAARGKTVVFATHYWPTGGWSPTGRPRRSRPRWACTPSVPPSRTSIWPPSRCSRA